MVNNYGNKLDKTNLNTGMMMALMKVRISDCAWGNLETKN